jgi:hypothetical protein
MKHSQFARPSCRRQGSQVLEYVIIAVGIAIFCTFGILMFGKSAQGQLDARAQVLTGNAEATDTSIHDAAKGSATNSNTDNSNRTGNGMDRR